MKKLWIFRLENLQANKPVSKMAEDKFKMLMNHELSVLSKVRIPSAT